jgi:hypothetical protein
MIIVACFSPHKPVPRLIAGSMLLYTVLGEVPLKLRIYDRVPTAPNFGFGAYGIVVVSRIRDDSVRFDAATLGRTVDEYCTWIQRPNSWGGEIELAILSEHFQVGIDSVDVKTKHVFSYGLPPKNKKTNSFGLY